MTPATVATSPSHPVGPYGSDTAEDLARRTSVLRGKRLAWSQAGRRLLASKGLEQIASDLDAIVAALWVAQDSSHGDALDSVDLCALEDAAAAARLEAADIRERGDAS